jgi:hypothetical protein
MWEKTSADFFGFAPLPMQEASNTETTVITIYDHCRVVWSQNKSMKLLLVIFLLTLTLRGAADLAPLIVPAFFPFKVTLRGDIIAES